MEKNAKTVIGPDGETPIRERQLLIVSTVTYSPDLIEHFEQNDGISMTVPDMAMSIQTIMEKYTQGGTLLGFEPQYYDDEFPDVSKMDLVDLQEAREQVQHELEHMNKLIIEKQIAEDAAAAAKVQKELEKQQKIEKLLDSQPTSDLPKQ